MNKTMLCFMLIFQVFFSLYAKKQDILIGSVTYIGGETMRFAEYGEKNTHTIVIYDAVSEGKKNELYAHFEAIFSAEKVSIIDQPGAVTISLFFDQNDYAIKSQLQDTLDGKKMLTISVYRVSAIRMLEQMTKKPILEYAKNKKILSEIA